MLYPHLPLYVRCRSAVDRRCVPHNILPFLAGPLCTRPRPFLQVSLTPIMCPHMRPAHARCYLLSDAPELGTPFSCFSCFWFLHRPRRKYHPLNISTSLTAWASHQSICLLPSFECLRLARTRPVSSPSSVSVFVTADATDRRRRRRCRTYSLLWSKHLACFRLSGGVPGAWQVLIAGHS